MTDDYASDSCSGVNCSAAAAAAPGRGGRCSVVAVAVAIMQKGSG